MTETITRTAQGATVHDSDADYQAVVLFDASPEAVFDALTTIVGLSGWWASASGSGSEGGELRLTFSGTARLDGRILVEDLLVLHVDAARRPSTVTWTVPACGFLPDWVGTRPSFELSPCGTGGCELRFRHQGLTPRLECFSACKPGWDQCLSSLHDYVETGRGRPFGSDAAVAEEQH